MDQDSPDESIDAVLGNPVLDNVRPHVVNRLAIVVQRQRLPLGCSSVYQGDIRFQSPFEASLGMPTARLTEDQIIACTDKQQRTCDGAECGGLPLPDAVAGPAER